MTEIPILMPQLGESIAEAVVINFLAQAGDEVSRDQNLLEVETNKAVMTVAAPVTGKVSRWTARMNESYPVGSILGYLEGDLVAGHGSPEIAPTMPEEPPAPKIETTRKVEPTLRSLPVPLVETGASYLSPRMKARMAEMGLNSADMAGIAGHGSGGRITVQDFEKFMQSLETKPLTNASAMRVAVADGMRRSWTRPLVTVGLTVPFEPLLQHRQKCNPRPGPALYALRALAIALSENSAAAGRLVGNRIVHPSSIDIGVAVEVDDGVLVPVIQEADKKKLCDMVPRYNQLVELARERRVPVEAIGNSVATITNYGNFGLEWGTPIPLPEQTLVLGMGAARKVPRWDEGKQQFVPELAATLTLSFDHRVLDGGAAGRLLNRIAKLLAAPETL